MKNEQNNASSTPKHGSAADKRWIIQNALPEIHAKVKDFRPGTRKRANRLETALKPILDIYYPKFLEAAEDGTDMLLKLYCETARNFLTFGFDYEENRKDEVELRAVALAIILHSLWWAHVNRKSRINSSTFRLISIIENIPVEHLKGLNDDWSSLWLWYDVGSDIILDATKRKAA